MRKTMIFLSVMVLLFGSCQEKAAQDAGDIEAKIELVKDYLLTQEGPGKDQRVGNRKDCPVACGHRDCQAAVERGNRWKGSD